MTVKILLQMTIPMQSDDWSIARFSLLAALLDEERDGCGQRFLDVTTRDRDPPGGPNSLLSNPDVSEYDQLWLFAADCVNGLTPEGSSSGIDAFRGQGGGVLVARDHMDPGCSVCNLAGIGRSQLC